MKLSVYAVMTVLVITLIHCVETERDALPSPTETYVKSDMEEGEKKVARWQWIELLHQSDSSVYWKNIETLRALSRSDQAEIASSAIGPSTSELVRIAGDSLIGFWDEKGSNNQAGSVIATTYDRATDEIYLVSAGGSLFKGARQGNQWEVVNQSLRFSGELLDFIDGESGKRLIGFVSGIPAWSDDQGATWSTVDEWMQYTDGWGGVYHPVISRDSQTIVTLAKPSYWSNLSIWYSSDKGETYHKIRDLDSHNPNEYKLTNVRQSNEILFIDKVSDKVIDIYQFNENTKQFDLSVFVEEQGFGSDGKANMSCIQVNDSTVWFYFFDENNDLYHSPDNGESWTYQSTLPEKPWNVGIYVLPSDPEFLLMGAVECFKSGDKGKTWFKQNSWGEYYNNVESKLHADMMYFREFLDPEGNTFIAISNHGGLSLSYDQMKSVENIGLEGLNVSQYYSVQTDPIDVSYVYAGSQDQGFQRAYNTNFGPLDFTQTISGDYGHIVFSEKGRHLWSVYPGGWVIYYENPLNASYPTLNYTLDSEDETVWLPPLAQSAYEDQNEIFMAGGNINGGEGSYLIHLRIENQEIVPSQFDFDFQKASGGKISAIHNSAAIPDKIYVATTNGHLYFTEDRGQTWTEASMNVPRSHYLYGATIASLKTDPSKVFIGGSGYSTAPVLLSVNGGQTFFPFDRGLPSTTVFGLALDDTDKYLFAATEAGPYVCIIENGQWYSMGGNIAPNQTYWSVDYIEGENTVRFGTYGRGIWDFYIESTSFNDFISQEIDWVVYPNPVSDHLILNGKDLVNMDLRIIDLQGKFIISQRISDFQTKIDLSDLSTGVYLVTLRNKAGNVYSKKIIKE